MLVGRPKDEIEFRSQIIRADFDCLDKDYLRRNLFDAQSGFCAICMRAMQSPDSIFCQIDHAASVYIWAEQYMPLDEATRQANCESNLVLAHGRCNSIKSALDLEEFQEYLKSGEINLDELPLLTEAQMEDLKRENFERRSEAGKKRAETMGPEKLAATAKKIKETMGQEGLSAAYRKRIETMGPERCSAAVKKSKETMGAERCSAVRRKQIETMGSERRSTAAKRRAENMGPERLSAARRKQIETMGAERCSAASNSSLKN